MCQPDVRASFQRSGDEYDLAISEESPPVPSAAPSCAGGPLELSFTLTLGAPVRGSVQATVNGQDLPVSAPQSPTLGELTCADNITLVDATRLVTSCSDAGVVDYHSQDPKTSNPSSDPNRLHLWWGSDTCVVDRRIDFAATADGGYLATVTESDLAGCNPMPEAWSIDLDFASPIAADKVYVNAVFPHTPFAPTTSTIKCSALAGQGAGGITLTDETGLVVSCASVAGDTSSGDFTVANPGNDFRQDLLQWWGGPCDGSPSVAFSKSSRGYLVQLHLAPLCQPTQRDHVFGLLLNMNSDVDVGSAGATFEETRGATD